MSTSFLEELWPRAQAALSNSPFFELRELLVEARDDTLFISGRVTSFYHKQLAQEAMPFAIQLLLRAHAAPFHDILEPGGETLIVGIGDFGQHPSAPGRTGSHRPGR